MPWHFSKGGGSRIFIEEAFLIFFCLRLFVADISFLIKTGYSSVSFHLRGRGTDDVPVSEARVTNDSTMSAMMMMMMMIMMTLGAIYFPPGRWHRVIQIVRMHHRCGNFNCRIRVQVKPTNTVHIGMKVWSWFQGHRVFEQRSF